MDLAVLTSRVLVVNAGSSSVKLSVLDAADGLFGEREVEAEAGRFEPAELDRALEALGEVGAAGHRVVHGGARFHGPVLLDADVLAYLHSLEPLAPLHQRPSLEAMTAVTRARPGIPAVACFDTAFHHRMSEAAATYALPAEWRSRWDLRRYGFHGLSHEYAARRAAEILGRDPGGMALVSCHLGAGCSLAAVAGGRSVDTTMGFTPLEGLVMATRSGSVDPGLLLWLEQQAGLADGELADALERRSGLAGLAGTPDMREVLARSGDGDPAAGLALQVYIHRLRAGIAAMAAALGRLDALVFTGGVGQNAPAVRAMAVEGLGFLGVRLDRAANDAGEEGDVSDPAATARCLVVRAREDVQIAREVRAVLAAAGGGATMDASGWIPTT